MLLLRRADRKRLLSPAHTAGLRAAIRPAYSDRGRDQRRHYKTARRLPPFVPRRRRGNRTQEGISGKDSGGDAGRGALQSEQTEKERNKKPYRTSCLVRSETEERKTVRERRPVKEGAGDDEGGTKLRNRPGEIQTRFLRRVLVMLPESSSHAVQISATPGADAIRRHG
ncbi:hypothetical protein DPEC_G00182820 [Dallia pectoralis]|uniref:Uncharacterized protein n=1 Tax=Dallia pectoralis TaxID=75939 RepID=A0ACC2GAU6_DALPE|nr:hypothetical protein DPEC_G00182820 [Dallia pectoralis]